MNESELFNAAVKLSAADCEKFLKLACKGNPELRGQVEALLKAHFDSATFLRESNDQQVERRLIELLSQTTKPAEQPGTIIAGRYKLIEAIGEGGMGAVWLAEQKEPVKRKVAIKLIKAGMDSKQVLSRFEAERQALALMDHPNIAKVFDGGMTEQNRPFFAMEYVKGMPLTEYCDQARLSLKERLKLFTPVCQAVQHAHQKGIIHRDLKPSNILICLYDGQPVPKVIDFGLAKAMHHSLTEQSLHTAHGVMVGTPLYMSPEQAEHNNLDVDTRTDIYSLGVILYELLTGSTPLEKLQLKEAAFNEVLRLIKEVEPPKPSTRLSSSLSLPSIAAQRSIEPNQLKKSLVGDLDWIVMKALDKERSRRYETASSLARDVERFLNDEAVEACPPSTTYRLKKMLRRNKGAVLAASLVLLALIVGMTGTIFGLFRANLFAEQQQLAKIEAETQTALAKKAAVDEKAANEQSQARLTQIEKGNEVLTSIFDDLNIGKVKEGTEPLEAVLANRLIVAAGQLDGESVGDPLVVAGLQNKLGAALVNLGYPAKAIPLFRKAKATRAAKLGADHSDTLTSMNDLAGAYLKDGKVDLALPLFEETLRLCRAKPGGADHYDTYRTMNDLACAYRAVGRMDLALRMFEEAQTFATATLGPNHHNTLVAMNNVAMSYETVGKRDLALQLLEKTLPIDKAALGADHPDTLVCMCNLAEVYERVGKLDLSLALWEDALRLTKIRLGAEHVDTLGCMSGLGACYQSAGKLDLALPLLEETLQLLQAKLATDHPNTLKTMNSLALGYLSAGKFELALPLLEENLRLTKALSGADHPNSITSMNNLAVGLYAVGKLDDARQLYEETLHLRKTIQGADHPDTILCMNGLASSYNATGKLDLALPLFEEILRLQKINLGADHPDTLDSMADLGSAYVAVGRGESATENFKQYIAGQRKRLPESEPEFAESLAYAGMDLLKCQQYVEAELLLRECLSIREKFAPQDWRTFNARAALGGSLLGQKKLAEAESLLVTGYNGMKEREQSIPPAGSTRIPETLERLVELYTLKHVAEPDQGFDTKAAEWQQKLDEFKPVEQLKSADEFKSAAKAETPLATGDD